MEPLLKVSDLSIGFNTEAGLLCAVSGVSFEVGKKEKFGIIGESGCGKSVTALSLLRLIPDPPGKILGGKIIFDNQDLMALPMDKVRAIRGKRISMIFQEPVASLNPVFTVGSQIAEVFRVHEKSSRKEAHDRAVEMIKLVRIPDAERRAGEYPHQLSGGMCQRIMIAMALSLSPELLIADEPTTALDVTIQAQILELINELTEKFGMSLILITHDLGVVAETVQRVMVMYTGLAMELASTDEIFSNPLHPYTKGLMEAMPGRGLEKKAGSKQKLYTIPGLVPSPLDLPKGCPFQERCPLVKPHCREAMPQLEEKRPSHWARCFEVR
jgi:oligopeptide/dipeptide ABC transporter ATP-binding protein